MIKNIEMGLNAQILNAKNKALIVEDFCTMIDVQLASKSGISGMALKAAFAALKGIQSGYIPNVVESLLPQCLTALDPIWSEGVEQGEPVQYLTINSSRSADALLGITDERIKQTKRQIVRGTYDKFRNSAKKHVEEAVPDIAKIIGKYVNNLQEN
jgi:hypothetical protein